jgi:CRISPR-associated protein Csm2
MSSTDFPNPKKIISPNKVALPSGSQVRHDQQTAQSKNHSEDITTTIIQEIDKLPSFGSYPIRMLVEHARDFGPHLKRGRLETNQIRKFLDALNQIKAKLTQIDEDEKIKEVFRQIDLEETSSEEKNSLKDQARFQKIESDIVLLKPKLAYASARQDAVTALSKVMAKAIDKVYSLADFERLVQFLESTIAYHKASEGKN